MTTAHRPTWKAAVGQANEGGWAAGGAVSHQSSVLDAPAHLSLKFRPRDNNTTTSTNKAKLLQESLLALQEAEANQQTKHSFKKLGPRPVDPVGEDRAQQRLLKQTAEVDVDKIKKKYNDSDMEDDSEEKDSDESDLDALDDLDEDDDLDSDEEDDDEAALQAELEKIRQERQKIKLQEEAAAAAQEEEMQQAAAVLGNPLLNNATASVTTTGRLKRRWNDDVVFRNQAKNEPTPKKRFINDTVRNDFHKRFLNKFMR